MKMPADAFAALEKLFADNALLDPTETTAVIYREIGYSSMRYRWDQFWRLSQSERDVWFDDYMIYAQMNDTHIDTALRKIFPADWSTK